MANPNLLDPMVRKQILDEIKSFENAKRKEKSLKANEIYNDNAYPYVYDELARQLSIKTADQMPIVSNLNIAKAVVRKEATIYTDDPVRTYDDITDDDSAVIKKLYSDHGFNTVLGKANAQYKLRNQSFIQVVPKDGALKLRMIQPHNLDVIPDADDPEKAYAYIVSTFDRITYLKADQNSVNESIGDPDDYRSSVEKYQIYTKEIIFTVDGKNNVVGEIFQNPIGELPFVDVSSDKDFEFFVRIGQALTDFTVDFNVAWSDLLYVARMQGFSVGVLKGDPNLKPDNMIVGPNRFVFLPTNPNNPDSTLDLDFKSPTPNIGEQLEAIEALVTTFLTTRGLDSKAVNIKNGGASFSSALERLMSMIDQFRATKSDFDLFKWKEKEIHTIVTKYLALLSGTNLLDRELWVSPQIVNSKMTVNFAQPHMIETRSDMLANAKSEIDLGIEDAVSVKAKIDGISIEQAEEAIELIQERRRQRVSALAPESETTEDDVEDESGDSEDQS